MKKHILLLLSIAPFFAMTGNLVAAVPGAPPPVSHSHPMILAGTQAAGDTTSDSEKGMTLDEAREYNHERAEKTQKYAKK